MKRLIIDCHTHFSTFDHEGQTFEQIRNSLLLSMQKLDIDYAFVYPDSEPSTVVTDLDTTRELVKGFPQLLMLGTACFPMTDKSINDKLDTLALSGDIIGIKLYPGFEEFYPSDGCCHSIYEICIKHNIPVVFHSGETMNEPWRESFNHPSEITNVARHFPSLKIVVAHFSQPHLTACQNLILNYPNVYADISGLVHMDVVKSCGQEVIYRCLSDVATVQPDKLLFGTDWPICDVAEHLGLVESLPVSEATKVLILSGNAQRVFTLEL